MRYPELDDSLTSLMWLQDFSILNTSMGKSSYCPSGPDPHDCHRIPSFAAPCSPLAADPACMGMPHTPCKPISSSTSRTAHHAVAMHPQLAEDIDYKTNPHVKPPYSYATLICMAMEASKKPKITLAAIYKWITDNFCYFRHADPTWQVGDLETSCLVPSPHRAGKGFPQPPPCKAKSRRDAGSYWEDSSTSSCWGRAVTEKSLPVQKCHGLEGSRGKEPLWGRPQRCFGSRKVPVGLLSPCGFSWLQDEGISVPTSTFLELLWSPESLRAEHT